MKIGLALSGGGVMGAAHIGVLEELETHDIKVDNIAGSSVGAIIGLLYSSGGINSINEFMNDMDKEGLFRIPKLLVHKNHHIFAKIEELLRKNIKEKRFSDLKINFCCVATDIISGESNVLETGDPVSAVMASAAYPGVFPAQKVNDKFFVDGGLTKNLPVSALKEKGSKFIIGSSLYSISKLEKIDNKNSLNLGLLKTAIRSIDILSKQLAEEEASRCDFCFYPPVESFYWFNFDKVHKIRELGEEYAQKEISNLLKVIKNRKGNFWQTLIKG